MDNNLLDKNDELDGQSAKYISGKKNVLVTGGAGFIGSNLCQILVKNNNVLCVDNYLTGQESNIDHLLQLPNFKFIRHDITEPLDLNQLQEAKSFKVEFQGIQEIYHAASPTHFEDHQKYPLETSLANSLGTKNVLDWAVKHKSQVLLFSTSLIYGNLYGEQAINENMMGIIDPLGERNCYVEGKRYAESLAFNYSLKHNLDIKIARIFNTYGGNMRASDNLLIPYFIDRALKNESIEVKGTGDEMVSACYISDILDGILKLMASEEKGPINLGSDVKIKISELVAQIIKVANSTSQVSYTSNDEITVTRNIPDISLAKNKLEWMPVVSFVEGLASTIADFQLAQKRVKIFNQA
jgi:UDP-glucuronate decarboxylase